MLAFQLRYNILYLNLSVKMNIFISLSEYSYKEERCQRVIEAMKNCCDRNFARDSELCSGFKIELSLKRMGKKDISPQ